MAHQANLNNLIPSWRCTVHPDRLNLDPASPVYMGIENVRILDSITRGMPGKLFARRVQLANATAETTAVSVVGPHHLNGIPGQVELSYSSNVVRIRWYATPA